MFSTQAPKRRRITGVALVTGAAGSLIVALSLGASLSGFVATITNSTNTAASATLAITETGGGGAPCNSYDTTTTCTTINKYGGTGTPLVPGGSQTTTVTFTNSGNTPVSAGTLAPGACVASTAGGTGSTTPTTPNTTAGNLCSVLAIAVYPATTATGTALYSGPASGFTATKTLGAIAAGSAQDYTFVVTLPTTATTAVQGQKVSQPLTWNFNQ